MKLPPPLEEFPVDEAVILSSYIEDISFQKSHVVFRMDDEADGLYLIDKGVVRIEIDREGQNPDEQDSALAFLEVGDIFGELGLLDGKPRSASAIAHTDITLRKVSRQSFERLQEEHPRVGMMLAMALGRGAALKLRATSGRLDSLIGSRRDPVVETMIGKAAAAQEAIRDWSEDRIDALTFALASAVEAQAEALARAAVEETGMGNAVDKTLKNRVASLGVWHSFHGKPGAGVIASRRSEGVIDVACPIGIIFGIVPMTNPTSTFIFKVLIAIKSRNAVILSPNRGALQCCNLVGEIITDVLVRSGAPADLVQWIMGRNSRKQVITFMNHPKVGLVLATGGPSVVKAAYSSGNPAIGVGAGNAPTLICSDAALDHAAASIASSKSFDNGLICGAEHNLLVVEARREAFIRALEANHVAVLDERETELFRAGAIDARNNVLRSDIIGQSAGSTAARIGVKRDFDIRVIVVPDTEISSGNPLSREKMTPVLSLYTVPDEEAGFEACRKLLEIDGHGHTAIIHTRDRRRAKRYGEALSASRILVNSPGAHGVVGMTTNLQPSLTLGCGTFGGTSTTDNVTYTHVRNVKRIAFYAPERLALLSDTALRLMRRRNIWISKIGRRLSWLHFARFRL